MPDVRKFLNLWIDLDEIAAIGKHLKEGDRFEEMIEYQIYLKGSDPISAISMKGTQGKNLLKAWLEKNEVKE